MRRWMNFINHEKLTNRISVSDHDDIVDIIYCCCQLRCIFTINRLSRPAFPTHLLDWSGLGPIITHCMLLINRSYKYGQLDGGWLHLPRSTEVKTFVSSCFNALIRLAEKLLKSPQVGNVHRFKMKRRTVFCLQNSKPYKDWSATHCDKS